MPKGSKNGIFSFDRFKLDAEKLMLYRDETELNLAPKIVKTLAVLIENRGSILSKDELIDLVWDDSIVEESNLSQNLYILRKTLGTKPDGGQYIETLRRRGYRFNAEVTSHSKNGSDVQSSEFFGRRFRLIGREKEIREVVALISREDTDLVTVSGVGGVGKTTFALAVAEQLKGDRDVVFVELAAVTRPEHVLSAIATEVGVKVSNDDLLLERIKEKLEGRRVLLVLDNFEQVVSAAPLLAGLINYEDHLLRILVTSRIPLRLKTESMFVLPPLQVPNSSGTASAFADLAQCEAVSLFVERAKQVQRDFELTPENAGDVVSICEQLGGLPLAIELAAARIRFLSPEAVRKRLQKQLDILKGTRRDAPARQQTMRETIAWSFALLPYREKEVFALLAVFSGGFDLTAVEYICSGRHEVPDDSILEVITSLVEHNLLTVRGTRKAEPRIQMLEVVREYAEEVLTDKGDIEAARRSHAEYYLQLGEQAEPQLLAARSAEWLERLEAEHDNLRAALAWAIENDALTGQRLAGAIWRFWWLHGHIREACEQLGAFLSTKEGDPKIRAKMLVGATFLNRLAGNSRRSRIYAEEGVELAYATGDLRTGALSLNQLGFLALDVGDFEQAERMFARGLKRAEELADIQILALLNNGLGELSRSKGAYDKASEFYGRALKYNREAGDLVRQTTCLINLGATALMKNDRESAGRFYRDGLQISSQMEDMNGTLYCLEGLAGSFWALHDPERAGMLLGAADAGRRKNNLMLEPADQAPYEESVNLVRSAVGEDSFNSIFSSGALIELKAAISLALDQPGYRTIPSKEVNATDSFADYRGGQVVVERHGNVLRLAEWSATKDDSTDPGPSARPDSSTNAGIQPQTRSSRWPLVALSFFTLVLAAAAFVLYKSGGSQAGERPGDLTILRLTNGDFPMGATISNDGKNFVFHTLDGDTYRLFIQQVGQPTKLELASFTDKIIYASTFSPDGRNIYFLTSDRKRDTSAIYRISAIGGGMTKIIDGARGPVSFSPDGKEMVYSRRANTQNENVVAISDKDGKNERVILTSAAPDYYGHAPAWSPDGKLIALSQIASIDGRVVNQVIAFTLSNGTVKRFSNEYWDTLFRMAWLPDGSGLAMIGTRENEGYSTRRDQIFIISAEDGKSRRITTDGNRHEIGSLGVAADGGILAVYGNRSSQLWSMDASGDQATAQQISKGAADGRAGLCPLPDGSVAYVARTGEDLSIWIANGDGSAARQSVTGYPWLEELRADPKGRFFVFSAVVDGKNRLLRAPIDSSEVKQITFGEGREIDSSISPDGEFIVYGGLVYRNNLPVDVIYKIPSSGGQPEQITDFECTTPSYSPNGEMIACIAPDYEAVIISAADHKEIRRFRFPANSTFNFGAGWTPDGSALTIVINEKTASNVWVFPISGEEPRRLTNFSSGVIYRHAFSLDGTNLFLARGYPEQDAELITNYR